MDTEKLIPIRKLPKILTNEVHDHIRLFSVAMLLINDEDSEPIPCAGTLTTIGETYGIITARHVWDVFSKHKNLLLMAGNSRILIETDKLSAVAPSPNDVFPETDISIPDIAYIKIPTFYSGQIEALTKAYYSIDKRANDQFVEFCQKVSGYWPHSLYECQRRDH